MTRTLLDTDEQREAPASKRKVIQAASSVSVRERWPLRTVSSTPTWARALGFYLLVAVLTIGRHAFIHPATVCACGAATDPASYMWALSWWPHAIVHGLNPFFTHYLWSPTGVNIAQGAMIPTAAILMAPITYVAGPVVSYNVLSIASPALAAFTAYLLCRRLVRRELPALAGDIFSGSALMSSRS